MSNARRKLCRWVITLLLLISYLPPSLAQETTSGAVRGRVYDYANSQGISGAKVTVVNDETGSQRLFTTDEQGWYTAVSLIPGRYTITATASRYENVPNSNVSVIANYRIDLAATRTPEFPPIALQESGKPSAASPQQLPEIVPERLAETTTASRGGNFGERELLGLPLPGVRTFDDLAFLLPGVALPPLAIGRNVGPGIGPGTGTSGQFAVNGIRSRSNNFTIDGSDNNDQDIGVRRQGFTSLVPQPLESIESVRLTTLLAEPQYTRNMGAQVNAVSRYGGSGFHGTLYGFLTDSRLKARAKFDFIGGASGGEDPFTRAMYGFAFGGPIVKQQTHFFASFERQDVNASREAHFAVPTLAERGLFNSGTMGLTTVCPPNSETCVPSPVFPASKTGNAFFSFFPRPNNPRGPYGPNTFSEVLPADGDGNVFSLRLDHNLKAFGKDHTLSGRYNFLDDDTILPVTGEALFSALRALVRTQNLAIVLNSQLSAKSTNILRFSYGRTHSDFAEVHDPFLLPAGTKLTNPSEREFLLNAPLIENRSLNGNSRFVTTGQTTEDILGPIGQVIISNYSPVGVDVFNFPQARTNQTFQYADTLFYEAGKNRFAIGLDTRRIHLDSRLDRNFRPLAVFSAAKDLFGQPIVNVNSNGFYQGRDFAAVGAPTGFFQTLSATPDSRINLRYWETAYFLSDKIQFRPNFSLTVGLRYELNTVPTDKDRRIESTFNSPEVRAIPALERFLAGRTKIFRRDNNNVAPYFAFAWDPTRSGRMAIRGGYGIYYDQIPGAVISQSRNVFPTFLPVDLAGAMNLNPTIVNNNRVLGFIRPDSGGNGLIQAGTLNKLVLPSGVTPAAFLSIISTATSGGGGPAFVLPEANLITPYSQHWSLTVEHQLGHDFLLSVAYVGTKGTHLLRFDTPNLGLNAIPQVQGAFGSTLNSLCRGGANDASIPCFVGFYQPPSTNGLSPNPTFRRPDPMLGAFTAIKSDANSIYHSLQAQANKRFSHGIEFTTSYTWSHAIDEVSDIFDLAGTRSLPQNSFDRRGERGSANFDVRHRFVYSVVWQLPGFDRKSFVGGWQAASIGTFQTGQPYTVLFCCDVNLDGNLTDRPGIVPGIGSLTLGPAALTTGRNTFRAPGIANVDLAITKTFRFSERHRLEFRSEFFNLFNRTDFGIPVHQFFFGGVAPPEILKGNRFVDTVLPARTVQFALKYRF